MKVTLLDLAQIGLVATINALMAEDKTRGIITRMVLDGRSKPNEDEERELNRESNEIHEAHLAAIAKAKAEGR